MSIRELVYSYETLHTEGFVKAEIDGLLKKFPNICVERFETTLAARRPIMVGKEAVIRPHDVLKAIMHGIMKPRRGLWKK